LARLGVRLAAFEVRSALLSGHAVVKAAVGLWLLATPPAILRWFDTTWLTIGGRILASWPVAIGLLRGGSKLVVQQRAEEAQGRRNCSCNRQHRSIPSRRSNLYRHAATRVG
jgi:hypothetical protein